MLDPEDDPSFAELAVPSPADVVNLGEPGPRTREFLQEWLDDQELRLLRATHNNHDRLERRLGGISYEEEGAILDAFYAAFEKDDDFERINRETSLLIKTFERRLQSSSDESSAGLERPDLEREILTPTEHHDLSKTGVSSDEDLLRSENRSSDLPPPTLDQTVVDLIEAAEQQLAHELKEIEKIDPKRKLGVN